MSVFCDCGELAGEQYGSGLLHTRQSFHFRLPLCCLRHFSIYLGSGQGHWFPIPHPLLGLLASSLGISGNEVPTPCCQSWGGHTPAMPHPCLLPSSSASEALVPCPSPTHSIAPEGNSQAHRLPSLQQAEGLGSPRPKFESLFPAVQPLVVTFPA